jgi:hypothetical protein
MINADAAAVKLWEDKRGVEKTEDGSDEYYVDYC